MAMNTMFTRGYKSDEDETRPPNPIALIFAFSVIILGFVGYFGIETYAKYLGTSFDAVVTKAPDNCDGSSQYIIVDIDNVSYDYYITYQECESGEYKQGMTVPVRMHPFRNELAIRENHPEYVFVPMFILIVGGAIITAFSKSSVKESTEHPVP